MWATPLPGRSPDVINPTLCRLKKTQDNQMMAYQELENALSEGLVPGLGDSLVA